MRKLALIITIMLLFLLGGGFSGVGAWDYDYTFGFNGVQKDAHRFTSFVVPSYFYASVLDIPELLKDIYRAEDAIKTLPSVQTRNASLLAETTSDRHAAAGETLYIVDPRKIGDFLHGSRGFDTFYKKVRIDIVKFLVEKGYSGFNHEPYADGNFALIEEQGNFKVLKPIEQEDNLDILLKTKLQAFKDDFADLKRFKNYLNFKPLEISAEEYATLGTLFMFKDEQDLRDLGYELISWKSRINTDPDYRKYNIKTAFSNIGHVRLILPGEIFSLGRALHYSPTNDGSQPFAYGYATIGGEVKMVYGGGLCGVATAFFQGALTNLGLSLQQYRAHSIYYRNLYEAEINGTIISEPGLDATLIDPYFDLKFQNIRDYPIVVVFNFDGSNGSEEQVLTLSKAQDRGSFAYIGSSKKGRMQCFTRNVNGKDITNCYNAVKNF